jgi:hypothetical protein
VQGSVRIFMASHSCRFRKMDVASHERTKNPRSLYENAQVRLSTSRGHLQLLMLRIFIPIVLGFIVWIIILWQVLLKKKKVDMKALLTLSVLFTLIWALLYWFLFR